MTVEITSRETMDATIVTGDLVDLVNSLNIAAASGKHFVLLEEHTGNVVALETRNITRMRELDDDAITSR